MVDGFDGLDKRAFAAYSDFLTRAGPWVRELRGSPPMRFTGIDCCGMSNERWRLGAAEGILLA